MNRRSILKLLGLAPVAAPAVAAIKPAPGILVHEKVAKPHVSIGARTVALEDTTGSYRSYATSGEGPVVTPPMRVLAGADGRVTLAIKATPLGKGQLRVWRDDSPVFAIPGNWSLTYPGEPVGEPTVTAFADNPGPGEHTYTLECDTGGKVALIATVA
jgi:hypothetical protein